MIPADFFIALLESKNAELQEKRQRVRDAFCALYPTALADLIAFESNPGCNCKSRLISLIESDLEKAVPLLKAYDPATTETKVYTSRVLGRGRMYEIGTTQESWAALMDKLTKENVQFQGVSLVAADDKLRVYLF